MLLMLLPPGRLHSGVLAADDPDSGFEVVGEEQGPHSAAADDMDNDVAPSDAHCEVCLSYNP